MFRKIFFSFIAIAFSLFVHAQDSVAVHSDDKPATGFRAEGKIYVVMLVSVTILSGLFIYLIRLDKKITKLENRPADTRRI